MIFYFRALNVLVKTVAKERYKVTDTYYPYGPILFILEGMMFIRSGKVPFHTGRKLEACQNLTLFLTICVGTVLSGNFSEEFYGSISFLYQYFLGGSAQYSCAPCAWFCAVSPGGWQSCCREGHGSTYTWMLIYGEHLNHCVCTPKWEEKGSSHWRNELRIFRMLS